MNLGPLTKAKLLDMLNDISAGVDFLKSEVKDIKEEIKDIKKELQPIKKKIKVAA